MAAVTSTTSTSNAITALGAGSGIDVQSLATNLVEAERAPRKAVIEKKITLIDYEEIRDIYQKRLVAFGHFAGLVGAYNALLHYGKKHELYALRPAHLCYDLKEMVKELQKLKLPPKSYC